MRLESASHNLYGRLHQASALQRTVYDLGPTGLGAKLRQTMRLFAQNASRTTMVTFEQAFAKTKEGIRLLIKRRLEARGYDLGDELDDSFIGLRQRHMAAAGLHLPEITAPGHVPAKMIGTCLGEEKDLRWFFTWLPRCHWP